jgi:hypothetical protein
MMRIPSFVTPLLFFVAFVSLPLISAVPTLADDLKDLQKSGRAVAAEKQSVPYDIKNRPPAQTYPVPLPPFSSDLIFPCTQCHAHMQPPNLKRRVMTEYHSDIVLHHADGRWCTDCHNPINRDKLRLISGELIDFSVSYRLCGQCHGDKYRDWKVGVHGKRTGYWNGDKQYLLCVHCHNPHDPKFKPLKPLPPPVRPANLRR